MNQQTQSETHRVLAVLDELLEDLCVLQHMPQDIQSLDIDGLASRFGYDTSDRICDHYDVERKVEMGQGAGNEELLFLHKNSTREMCDTLRKGLQSLEDSPNSALETFQTVMQILRGLMHDKLNTTVEEDMQKFEILRDTVSREQTASADVKALNREFKSEQNIRKVEVAKRDQGIQKLSEELKSIEENALEDAKDFERQTREQQQIATQTFQKEEEELLQTVKHLEANLQRMQEKNNKEEVALRQERRKKELGLEATLNQYDGEMTSNTSDLDQLQKDHKTDGERIEQLEKELKVFDEETSKRQSEERIENERKLHHMDILVRMETSAKLVQAFWRGFAVRSMLKKKSGKKKKKGGKKGKKK